MWMQSLSYYCIVKVNIHFSKRMACHYFCYRSQSWIVVPFKCVRFLPTNRVITEDDKNCILLYKEVGLSIREIIRVMELKKNVKYGHLPFFQWDIWNLYVKMRKMYVVNDAMDLLQFWNIAKERNSKLQYASTTDEEKMLKHIFWSHPHNFEMWLFFILLTR